jgi:hypothetical protein
MRRRFVLIQGAMETIERLWYRSPETNEWIVVESTAGGLAAQCVLNVESSPYPDGQTCTPGVNCSSDMLEVTVRNVAHQGNYRLHPSGGYYINDQIDGWPKGEVTPVPNTAINPSSPEPIWEGSNWDTVEPWPWINPQWGNWAMRSWWPYGSVRERGASATRFIYTSGSFAGLTFGTVWVAWYKGIVRRDQVTEFVAATPKSVMSIAQGERTFEVLSVTTPGSNTDPAFPPDTPTTTAEFQVTDSTGVLVALTLESCPEIYIGCNHPDSPGEGDFYTAYPDPVDGATCPYTP